LPDAVLGKSRKSRSWVLRKYLARSTDEPMMTGNEPKRRCRSGPYFLESSWMERCGSAPMRLKLPMTGHGAGPGGRLYTRPDLALSLGRMKAAAIASARMVTQNGDSSIGAAAALWSLERRGGVYSLWLDTGSYCTRYLLIGHSE
jgi:hypothetical protein